MKKIILSVILAVLMMNIIACGAAETNPEADMVSYIKVLEDETIEGVIVEDFSETYYYVDDLEVMIQDAINEYNQKDITAGIELISCELVEQQVKVAIRYGHYKAYAGFNSRELFVGTVGEAAKLGYDLNVDMLGTGKKAAKITEEELETLADMNIVIAQEPIRVICYDNIVYYTESATLVGKNAVDMEHAQGYGIVLFE